MEWNPEQYLKFRDERYAPFDDLIALVELRTGLKAVDLGCGTGELTRRLADSLSESSVLGIDSSPKMLEKAQDFERPGLTFICCPIEKLTGTWDLIFSNAALQWVDNHEKLIPALMSLLLPGGQLAVQLPSNHRNPAISMIAGTAAEKPFIDALNGWTRSAPVLEIDRYAELLHRSGGTDIVVFEKVYCHLLKDSNAVAEWTGGTTLLPYVERLPEEYRQLFLDRYRSKLAGIWPDSPLFFTFRRTFLSAKKNK